MPFFSKEQIDSITNALKAKLPRNPQVENYIGVVVAAIAQYENSASEEIKKIEYISNERLLGKAGLIRILINHYSTHANAESVIATLNNFLALYSPIRKKTSPEKFNNYLRIFSSHFDVAWSKEFVNTVPPKIVTDVFLETIQKFLSTQRIDINDLGDSEKILMPIATTATIIFNEIIKQKGFTSKLKTIQREQNAEEGRNIHEQEKNSLLAEFSSALNDFLTKKILPPITEVFVSAASRDGIVFSNTSLNIYPTEWLHDQIIKELIESLTHQIFPGGLPADHSIAEPFTIYDSDEIIKNLLIAEFNKFQQNSGTVYIPLNTGGHWVFLSITGAVNSDKTVTLSPCYIDSMTAKKEVTARINALLNRIFPTATIVSTVAEGTNQQTFIDNYTCGDRTIWKILEKISESTGQQKAFSEKNPWATSKPNNPESIRAVTQALLKKVRKKKGLEEKNHEGFDAESLGNLSRSRSRSQHSFFDEYRVLLGVLFLLLLAGIVTGGLGIGIAAGSHLALQLFAFIFPTTALWSSVDAATAGIIFGFGSSIILWIITNQGLANAFEEFSSWFKKLFAQPPATQENLQEKTLARAPQTAQTTTTATSTVTITNPPPISQPEVKKSTSQVTEIPTINPAPETKSLPPPT